MKPIDKIRFSRCWASYRWSFNVGNFYHYIDGDNYTCFPETDAEYQLIYNKFWRFIGAK